MSAEPLSREEREAWIKNTVPHSPFRRYEATVQAADERAEALRTGLAEMMAVSDDEWTQVSCYRLLAADDAARGEG